MLEQKRFGHDGAHATGPEKPGHGGHEVNEQQNHVAHREILDDDGRDGKPQRTTP
jgi:hypothetical protein